MRQPRAVASAHAFSVSGAWPGHLMQPSNSRMRCRLRLRLAWLPGSCTTWPAPARRRRKRRERRICSSTVVKGVAGCHGPFSSLAHARKAAKTATDTVPRVLTTVHVVAAAFEPLATTASTAAHIRDSDAGGMVCKARMAAREQGNPATFWSNASVSIAAGDNCEPDAEADASQSPGSQAKLSA